MPDENESKPIAKDAAKNESPAPSPIILSPSRAETPVIPSSVKIESSQLSSPRPVPIPIKIVPKKFTENGNGNMVSTEKVSSENVAFQARCKTFAPAIGTVIGLVDGSVARFVRNKVRKVIDDNETAKEICEPLTRSPESKKALTESLTRIVARRTENEELMDYVVVGTAIGETSIALMDVLSELRKISTQIAAQKKLSNESVK